MCIQRLTQCVAVHFNSPQSTRLEQNLNLTVCASSDCMMFEIAGNLCYVCRALYIEQLMAVTL